MADSSSRIERLLNPCLFHLQKMELELKCPACLKLFNDPVLLPCGHICCSSCITNPAENQTLCPSCKLPILNKELRTISHVETLVVIFRSMNASFANLLQPGLQAAVFEVKRPGIGDPVMCSSGSEAKLPDHRVLKEPDDKINTLSSNTRHSSCANVGEPCSPLSFGDTKDSDDDSNDSEHDHKLPSKVSCKRKIDGNAAIKIQSPLDSTPGGSMLGRVHSETSCQNVNQICLDQSNVDPSRELKRFKLEAKENGDNLECKGNKSVVDDVSMSNSESHFGNKMPCSIPVSDAPSLPCVFCHSSAESEFTGAMRHYDETGNLLDDSHALQPNVSHVHERCIDWAPQVYFDGVIAKNMAREVSRASKIKCSKCGQKGAALGCYAKSCRKSFHVPCALQVSGCRWDTDNFLLLCPNHFFNKFPSDRSRTQSKVKSTNLWTTSDHSKLPKELATEVAVEDLWMTELDITRGWVFCGSALSSSENNLLVKFAKKIGASVSRDWRPNVTHVIASTDEFGACSRTLKYLMAILIGKWILKIDWIKACLEAKCLIDEESYEINHDIHGCFDGPKNGRTRIRDKAPPLFSGLSFYFCGHFVPSYKGYLEDLIKAAGGSILKELDHFTHDFKSVTPTSFVVYNLDPPEECDLVDQAGAIKMRLEEADAIAASTGSQVVAHTWVLDSIAACKLQPLVC